MTAREMITHERRTLTSTMPLSYGATYLCRSKSMIVSLGYCEHCAECRISGNGELQLEKHRDVYA
jgi:hypothetical protein